MLQIEMSASNRSSSGKGPMRRLRAEGMTPGVVYGAGGEAQSLQLETKSLMAQLLSYYRLNVIVALKIDDKMEKNVLLGEVQVDPVRDTLVHIDFCEIDMNKDREFKVPVNYEGVAKGVDLGGVLLVQHPELVLYGKPLDMPDSCKIEISDLDIGDSIKCGDIAFPDNVTMVTDPKAMAVSVVKAGEKIEETDS